MLVRLQAEINDAQLEELRRMQKKVGMKATRKDVVTNALTLLSWAAKKKAQGYSIGALDREGKLVEFDMPFLDVIGLESRPSHR